ncbi:MAG TPA: DPP IV N-terminal domain-containing protein [Candidatus Limnocylindria bacterium]|nr:DPP IV N-terminal domain-containing protein [Candidatus Limnocylindria bacterium]
MTAPRRRLTIADAARQPAPGLDAPVKPAWVPGRAAVTYLHGPRGSLVRSLWWRDLADPAPRELVRPAPEQATEESLPLEEVLRRQRQRATGLGVTDYAWAERDDPPVLLVPLAGKLLLSRDGQPPRELGAAAGAAAPQLSPTGDRVSFVRDAELWVALTDDQARCTRISRDAGDGISNGAAEYVAAEELGRTDGHWWSADGSLLAYAHVDERPLARFVIPHWEEDPPSHEEHRYPFAGGPNARVTLRLADPGGGGEADVRLPMADDDYLARVVPHPRGDFLVAVLRRDQRSLTWLRVDSGGAARVAWVVEGTPWVNLDDATRILADGSVLRATEPSGFRHLELRAPDGSRARQLTGGEWAVTSVAHVDEARGEVWFLATRDGVLERHLYVMPLAGGEPERLTSEPGWHETVVAPDASGWIDTHSSLDSPPRVEVRFRDGRAPVLLDEPAADVTDGLPPPELLELRAADGETVLHAALHRPARAPDEPCPLVVSAYGGPRSQRVANAWSVTAEMRAQLLAAAGAAVLVVDNRGTANRGTAFEAALAGRLGRVEVEDQLAAVRALAERGEIDADRVAIYGWSYGGYLAIGCLLEAPDAFVAGVAGAPVTDWTGYDTAYTERYLGTPAENRDGYEASSLLGRAATLRRPLLLVHGALDENVHFRHTVRLLAAAGAEATTPELLVLPGERHGPRRGEMLLLRERRTVGFLCEHLGLPPPEGASAPPAQAAS